MPSDASQLAELVARVDAGVLEIEVAERRPLADLAAVHDHAAAGRLAGKTVLTPELTTAGGATIRLRWYARKNPSGEPGPAALYLYGGGMIVGHVGLFDGSVSRYVSRQADPRHADARRPHPDRLGEQLVHLLAGVGAVLPRS